MTEVTGRISYSIPGPFGRVDKVCLLGPPTIDDFRLYAQYIEAVMKRLGTMDRIRIGDHAKFYYHIEQAAFTAGMMTPEMMEFIEKQQKEIESLKNKLDLQERRRHDK